FRSAWSALQTLFKHSPLNTRHPESENVRDRRRNVDVRRRKSVIKARNKAWPMGHHGYMRIGWRKAAVIAPAVDRASVADSRTACHYHVFVEVKADDNVWTPPCNLILRVDKAHGQSARDIPILVTHKNCAELHAAL